MEHLAAELVMEIAFGSGVLGVRDVIAWAQTSKRYYGLLVEDPYGKARLCAHAGLVACVEHGEYRGALRALQEGMFVQRDRAMWTGDDLLTAVIELAKEASSEGWSGALLKALVLHPQADPYNGALALQVAAKVGNEFAVRTLLSLPCVDASADGDYALTEAVARNHTTIIQLLRGALDHDCE